MKTIFFIFLIFYGPSLFANDKTAVLLGTYSGLSESQATVAFELLKDGKAKVTTEFYAGEGEKNKAIDKYVYGSWVYKAPILTIIFGNFKDQFKKVQDCYENRPCFKFNKSESKTKSPLNVEYVFMNWDVPGKK